MLPHNLNLPGVDGGEFVRRLREDGLEAPVVAMTAAQNAQRWAQEIGPAAYVPKPINLPMVPARLDGVAA